MAGYGLSAKQYNQFFLENCDAVRDRMAEIAGREASAQLTSKAFGFAREVMSRVPSEGLIPELCTEILSGAMRRVEDELHPPVQEEYAQEAPAVAASEAAADTKPWDRDGAYIPEPEPEERETADPISKAEPPAGWAVREAALSGEAESPRDELYEAQHTEPLHIMEPKLEPDLEAELLMQGAKSGRVRHSKEKRKSKSADDKPDASLFWNKLLLALLIALILFLLWAIAGILMGQGILPRLDLGYTWFNATVFYFF